MRLLLDECCDFRLCDALRADGHDVLHVMDISPSAGDDAVWSMALNERRILVTNDNDFGLLFRLRLPTPRAIVLLRIDRLSPLARIERTRQVLSGDQADFQGLIVVEPSMVRRIRRPG